MRRHGVYSSIATLDAEDFQRLLARNPELAARIREVAASRPEAAESAEACKT